MITVHRRVWRTDLYLTARSGIDEADLRHLLDTEVARLDAAASRFRADSTVNRISTSAGEPVLVDDYLLDLLRAATAAAAATGGIVHPGLGFQVAEAGYDDWAGHDGAPTGSTTVLPWQSIELRDDGSVRIPAGMVLDLGAIAKAWLADRLAVQLVARTGAAVLANMGGDIRCIGFDEPWDIWLDAEVPGVAPRHIALRNAGIATSGLAHRRWAGGHHIIDPRTGRPARTPWWSASVIAADAVGANAAATASIVLGESAPRWLGGFGLTGWLVSSSGEATSVGALQHEEVAA